MASGRGDWIGWAELLTEIADETAIRMTARVMDELAADVLGIVEAEDRPALVRMNGEPAQPARLPPAVGGVGRHRHRRRHLPQGPVGRPWQRQPAQAWEIYSEITASVHAASDHAAVWVDLDL